jgi:hypothetical protein
MILRDDLYKYTPLGAIVAEERMDVAGLEYAHHTHHRQGGSGAGSLG